MNKKRAFSLIENQRELSTKEILAIGYIYNLYGYYDKSQNIIKKIFEDKSCLKFDIIESSLFVFLVAEIGENNLINFYKNEIIKITDILSC